MRCLLYTASMVEEEIRRYAKVLEAVVKLSELSTRELAAWLKSRMQEGEDLAFVIGGPDGLAQEVLARSNLRWSLSRLTLPHALVRVLLVEQLYRAHSILTHHPYHRD